MIAYCLPDAVLVPLIILTLNIPRAFLPFSSVAACKMMPLTLPQDPRLSAPSTCIHTHQTGVQNGRSALSGFISQSECSLERLSICPRLCYWQKAASGFKYSPLTPSLSPAFPFQKVLLALRKQLSSLLSGLIGFSLFGMGTSFLASEAAISLVSGDLGKKDLLFPPFLLPKHCLKAKNWCYENIVWVLGYFYWQPKRDSKFVTTRTV